MAILIQDFPKQSATAEVSLFFYAGHGVQFNDLLPVDADIPDDFALRLQSIDADEAYRAMVGKAE